MSNKVRIGQVYWMLFPGGEHVQAGRRPGIVWQNNVGNENSPNIIAIPLTSKLKKMSMPTHVVLDTYTSLYGIKSMAVCEGKQSIPKSAIQGYICDLSSEDLERVAVADLLTSGGLCFVTPKKLSALIATSVRLNSV